MNFFGGSASFGIIGGMEERNPRNQDAVVVAATREIRRRLGETMRDGYFGKLTVELSFLGGKHVTTRVNLEQTIKPD